MGHVGAGIVGDKLYDPDEDVFMEMSATAPILTHEKSRNFMNLSDSLMRRLIIDAHALHAKSLKFRHPRSGKIMEIKAPPPSSWHGLY
jgi:23S rRNA-/tRNA-specific pseudouridylate synthase